MRIDIELLNRKMFESRNKAQIAIKSGCIYVNNKKITQSSFDVTESDTIIIKGKPLKYVSKGGLKLEKIIKNLKLDLSDKILVDVGASTGGFTDCAIQNGIKKVYTIDV
ncbi:MAG: TlyA family rRNA (cytidine-2'-O)-methyltransferase, partial [Clostridia bacterium]|nr:TlyA family rRNA (cytidine-2'-O)-methyltransferase [Clostridia bacterium]